MKNSKSETPIIKDIAVFNYVAGQQSDGTSKNFERLLEQDADLMQEVAIEEQLRSTLEQGVSIRDSEPVSMKNFDALLDRINSEESDLDSVATSSIVKIPNSATEALVTGPWTWQRQFNIAASIVFVAMIGFIGFNQITEPEFTTLSNQTASSEIDFAGLVEQHRLVKLELADGLTPSDIDKLLQSYQLQSVQSGTVGQVILVSAQQGVNGQQLTDWLADARIIKAELVSFSAK